jgi:hypothetical protein
MHARFRRVRRRMITLYQFPPAWGVLNPSPFCMKVEMYLRMVELPSATVSDVTRLFVYGL